MKMPFSALLSKASGPPPDADQKSAPNSSTPLVALQLSSGASWSPRNYAGLSREAYQRNPIAYRCVRLVGEAAASVRLCARRGDSCLPDDPAGSLLSRGMSGQTAADVMESFYGYLQVSGNAYLEAAMIGGAPSALYALRPDRISVQTNREGWPCAYSYEANGRRKSFACDPASGRSALFHMRLFDPLSDTQGFSPLEAAAQAVDIHNEGGRWTKALLDNSARPSGALIYKAGESGQYMCGDQFDRIKAELEGAYSGARHAGRPMVLEGGLDWKSMSLSPADMDFLEARREAAREIALALGVPPMLLGIPGDNTYANYKEANLAFWRQTIIPLVTKTARGMESWLRPWLGDDLSIHADFDAVSALSEERRMLWERLSAATFLSDAERRDLAGLEPLS
ncbi:MAG: phage portal protein [Alphaproteobacteria bacterium]